MFAKYDFSSKEEVQRFDADLNGCAYVFGAGLGQISLVGAFDRYYAKDRKVFYIVLDLKLCLFNLLTTMRELERLGSRRDIADTFCFHRAWFGLVWLGLAWFGFVATYRAFYDKFMNLIVAVYYPDRAQTFENARSRKGKFISIVEAEPTAYSERAGFIGFPGPFVAWMDRFIRLIDDQYRTAEVHGPGVARKWVFSEEDLQKTPYVALGTFVDNIAQFFQMIACVASGADGISTKPSAD